VSEHLAVLCQLVLQPSIHQHRGLPARTSHRTVTLALQQCIPIFLALALARTQQPRLSVDFAHSLQVTVFTCTHVHTHPDNTYTHTMYTSQPTLSAGPHSAPGQCISTQSQHVCASHHVPTHTGRRPLAGVGQQCARLQVASTDSNGGIPATTALPISCLVACARPAASFAHEGHDKHTSRDRTCEQPHTPGTCKKPHTSAAYMHSQVPAASSARNLPTADSTFLWRCFATWERTTFFFS
jgi:hypothetical protein